MKNGSLLATFILTSFLSQFVNASYWCKDKPSFQHPLAPKITVCTEEKLVSPEKLVNAGELVITGNSTNIISGTTPILSSSSSQNGNCELRISSTQSALNLSIAIKYLNQTYELTSAVDLPWTGSPLLLTSPRKDGLQLGLYKSQIVTTEGFPGEYDLFPGTADINLSILIDKKGNPLRFHAFGKKDGKLLVLGCDAQAIVGKIPSTETILY